MSGEAEDAQAVDGALELLRSGDVESAERALRDVIARTPADYVNAFERAGQHFIKFWSQDEFLAYVTRAKARVTWLRNAYPRAHYYLGFIAVKRKRFEEAIRWLDAGHRLQPDQPSFALERGQALSSLGRFVEALAEFDAVLRGDCISPRDRALGLRGRGFQLIELGRLDEAASSFRDSLKLEPNSPVALNELRYIHGLREGFSPGRADLVETTKSSEECDGCRGVLGAGWRTAKSGDRILRICAACATKPGAAWDFWK
jgi:tetratricopeptide (TPR) repeat protein